MIRKFEERDLETVMELWLAGNLQAHSFIPKRYWKDSRELVKDLLPSASLYVYTEETGRPDGFIGLSGDYIEGIFVREGKRSCGIGAGLCQELWQTAQYFIEGMQSYAMVDTGSSLMPMAQFLNLWTTIGASGACYGVLLAYGMTFPEERIMLLIPPIPIKAKYFVAGYAVIEVLSAFSSNSNIAHLAHLGGMLFGLLLLLYWRHQARGARPFGGWSTYTPRRSRWERLRDGVRGLLKKKKGAQGGATGRFKDREADYDFNARRKEREQKVDEILDKIRRSGYDSLTDEEKDELFRNSRR